MAAVFTQQHILIVSQDLDCVVCDRPDGAFSNKVGKTLASESKGLFHLMKADIL